MKLTLLIEPSDIRKSSKEKSNEMLTLEDFEIEKKKIKPELIIYVDNRDIVPFLKTFKV